jgi:hydrogenase maturation protease
MPHTVIVGYGNPLRGDDGVGIRVAGLLADAGLAQGVQVIACHQLNVELAPQIAEADRLILIDACASGEPGTVCEEALTAAPIDGGRGEVTSPLQHHVDARGLLAMAQVLYGHAPETRLFTVSGGSFEYGETLSPPVADAAAILAAQIRSIIEGKPPDAQRT